MWLLIHQQLSIWMGEIACAYQDGVRHIKVEDPVNANPTLLEQLIQLLRLTRANKNVNPSQFLAAPAHNTEVCIQMAGSACM